MRLSMMWSIDRTIDASGSSPVAAHILANWRHDPGSLRFFRSSANFVYVFSHDGRQHFLRFTERSERSRNAVEIEVALLHWLAGAGIAVAVPVPSKRGNDVETMTTAWGTFHAVVFPAVAGTQFALDELDSTQFQAWGAVLGRLHATLTTCPVEISSALPTWQEWLEQQRRCLDDEAPVVRNESERMIETLETLPVNGATFGLVHYDVELDNLVWDDHTVHVLDFDDCQRCWYVADIAFALRDLFDDGASVNDPEVQAFVSGYVAHHPLDEDPFTHLPLFVRLATLLTYVQSVRALDLAEDPTHPEWLNELIRKLRRRMDTYEQSLAAGGP